jgi:hypothetical protein
MLEMQVNSLLRLPAAGMVHSDFQTIDPDGKVIEESVAKCRNRRRPSGKVFRELFLDSFIAASSVLIRKECIDRLGGFDETLLWGDYHLWLRIAWNYEIHYVPHVLVKYRQHGGQSTRSFTKPDLTQEPVSITAIKSVLEMYPEARQALGEQTIRHRMASIYFGGSYFFFDKGDFKYVRPYLKKAIGLQPLNARYLAVYAASYLTPSSVIAARKALHSVRSLFVSPTSAQWQSGQVQ